MNILVFLCGVHDPKWPLPDFSFSDMPKRSGDRAILSPFDEAALELALRLKQHCSAEVAAVIIGGEEMTKLARSVISLKADSVTCLAAQNASYSIAPQMAGELAAYVKSLSSMPDLIFVGREFGDFDDGVVAPMMARACELPFWPLAQDVDVAGPSPEFIRERAGAEERLLPNGPTVVSVTNDRRNRLRKPLMKNVIGARKAEIGIVQSGFESADKGRPQFVDIAAVDGSREHIDCRVLSGSIADQANELADILLSSRGGQ